jgi:uncharacterized surface protein with fasciclin (FAS1) repeats
MISCNNNQNTSRTDTSIDNTDQNNASNSGQSAVVDDVSQKNVVQVASESADHSTLVTAVKAADLVNALSNAGPFTVFAPTNSAFDLLPSGTVDDLLKEENKTKLQNILEYHVTVGVYNTDNLQEGQVIGQVNGDNLKITIKNGKPTVNDANIIASIPASNGVIHIIDKVLLPPVK